MRKFWNLGFQFGALCLEEKGPSVSFWEWEEMKELVGRPGSVSGLVLRLGQFSCAAASIGVMVSSTGFASFTAFWYCSLFFLIIMLQIFWISIVFDILFSSSIV